MTQYKVPCGQNTGHGESCSKGRLCAGCAEVRRLREWIHSDREQVRPIDLYLLHTCMGMMVAGMFNQEEFGPETPEREALEMLMRLMTKRCDELNRVLDIPET